MLFTHDTELALASTADLVNTAADPDLLPDVGALAAFLDRWEWSGRRDNDDAEVAAVRDLRPRLRRLWVEAGDGGQVAGSAAHKDTVVQLVNDLLAEYDARPYLVRHDGWDYHLHATSQDAPLVARMAVEAGMAMADMVRADELSRLRICEMSDCDDVLVDLSRNRSKRYCGLGCTNRAAVHAYRARKSAPPSG